jgi:hypothetical protein
LFLDAEANDEVAQQDGALRATARAYHTHAEIFPDMGHDMMLEPGWADVAERIHTWPREQLAN